MQSTWKHSLSLFPYRSQAPKGIIENTLVAVGGIFRGVGAALDEFGAMMQGPGALKEKGACPAVLQRTAEGSEEQSKGCRPMDTLVEQMILTARLLFSLHCPAPPRTAARTSRHKSQRRD